MSERSLDEVLVFRACREAQAKRQEIPDEVARVIASWWHNGQFSKGYSFVSTGAITDDPSNVWHDLVGSAYSEMLGDHKLAADMLGTYLVRAGRRQAQRGWRAKWVR